jgi:hypothetical protein
MRSAEPFFRSLLEDLAIAHGCGLSCRVQLNLSSYYPPAMTDVWKGLQGDTVYFEFCLHEMDDPEYALIHAKSLAPDIVV